MRLLGELREVLMTDGTWQPVTVLAQAPDLGGGWRVQLRWFDHGTFTGWFLLRGSDERKRFREVSE